MWEAINSFLTTVDNLVWGVPLMVLIMAGGILLTARLGLLQMRRLPLALKWMFKNEEEGDGEISSFAALCTALSATIGTGNIVGVATAVCAGGPGALFWMILAAFFGMATKFSEGLLAVKYRVLFVNLNHLFHSSFTRCSSCQTFIYTGFHADRVINIFFKYRRNCFVLFQ